MFHSPWRIPNSSSVSPLVSYKDAVRNRFQSSRSASSCSQSQQSSSMRGKLPHREDTNCYNDCSVLRSDKVWSQTCKDNALVSKFKRYWPSSEVVENWVSQILTKSYFINFCNRGLFLFFLKTVERNIILLLASLWGRTSLFMKPWFPEFNLTTIFETTTPVWVRLPNLLIQLCQEIFKKIGNTLGQFIKSERRNSRRLYTCARPCAESDLSKGLLDKIILDRYGSQWVQTLESEKAAIRCRICHETGFSITNCPTKQPQTSHKRNIPL